MVTGNSGDARSGGLVESGERCFEPLLSLGGEFGEEGCICGRRVVADDNGHHHAHREVGQAFDDVGAGHFKCDDDLFPYLAPERLCTLGNETLDGLGIVPRIGGDES